MSENGKPSSNIVYMIMILMVVTGSCNTIFNKLLNEIESLDKKFTHFFFQTYLMFVGEVFCLFAYYFFSKSNEEESDKPKIKPIYLSIPALCDFIGSTVTSFSLTMMAASVYQMSRGSVMIYTAVLSIVFLKSKLYRYQLFSLSVIFVALFIVGIGALSYDSDNTKTSLLGVITLVIAQLFTAIQFVIEEKILNKYDVNPLQMVGWEGVFGTIFYSILLIIFYFIKCNPDNPVCYMNQAGEVRLEDFIFAFKQLYESKTLCFIALGYVICIASYNYAGITMTKYVSSPARAVMDNARTVVIWLFFLITPGLPIAWRESFIPMQLLGFLLLVLGTFVYNQFISFSCLEEQKSELENKETDEESLFEKKNDEITKV